MFTALRKGLTVRYRIVLNPAKRERLPLEAKGKRGRIVPLSGADADQWWLGRAADSGLHVHVDTIHLRILEDAGYQGLGGQTCRQVVTPSRKRRGKHLQHAQRLMAHHKASRTPQVASRSSTASPTFKNWRSVPTMRLSVVPAPGRPTRPGRSRASQCAFLRTDPRKEMPRSAEVNGPRYLRCLQNCGEF
ncbi:hypothetical protein NEH83_33310 [Streptomyces sp. JUS-F4]|uniref:hypothetical protein n=1 Tax=Streptomyces sp. JUS-F4 TaxID=2951988 RepID=UPI0026668B99|nr:hypothetical protein [Streptomyces sp. JUS-F4]WKN18642.1 hypothetical protein NEH83_33310 [Streptomyces sp. JUS-F4]